MPLQFLGVLLILFLIFICLLYWSRKEVRGLKLKIDALQQDKSEMYNRFKIGLIQEYEDQSRLDKFEEQIKYKNMLIDQLKNRITETSGEIFLREREMLITQLSQLKILTDTDWQKFQELFSKVHIGLIDRLKTNYPKLTEAELRLLLLIKLKFSTKLNAEILGISVSSVRKSRYRLKKKLCVNGEELDQFIENQII